MLVQTASVSARCRTDRLLFPSALLLCCIGVYRLTNSPQAIWLMLGFVLGGRMEKNFRRAMLVSGGDAGVFVDRPVSRWLLIEASPLLALPACNRGRGALRE